MINFFDPQCIIPESKAATKEEILREISALAKRSPHLKDFTEEQILNALKERENVSSTGLEKGIAIPHCCFDKLDHFVVGLVVVPGGIDFGSFDKKKTNLFFFIIGDGKDRNRHIKILSSISRMANENEVLKKLKSEKDKEKLITLLNEDSSEKTQEKLHPQCQFIIHIQNEELFDDVLSVLSSEVEGSISVLESVNAGYYLNQLPLFASFWNETHKKFSRVIIAVVDKRLMNETIRQINMIREKSKGDILLTVHELAYSSGSIDF